MVSELLHLGYHIIIYIIQVVKCTNWQDELKITSLKSLIVRRK